MLHDIFYAALEWATEYREYCAYGWDATTISALLMTALTSVEVGGIVTQGWKIWKERSVKSVSAEMYLYTFPFFLLCAVFGWEVHSAAMVFNAVPTALVQIPVLVGLVKFKGFTERERALGSAYAFMPVVELYTDYRGLVYSACSIILWWAFLEQLRKLWQKRETGAVSAWLFFCYWVSSASWIVFAYETENWFVFVSISGAITFITIILVSWWWLRAHEIDPPWPLRVITYLVRKVLM